jgi:hypothetical protein
VKIKKLQKAASHKTWFSLLSTASTNTPLIKIFKAFGFYFIFGFCTSFRPTKGGRLIRLVRKGMRTGQALFPLEIEPGFWIFSDTTFIYNIERNLDVPSSHYCC